MMKYFAFIVSMAIQHMGVILFRVEPVISPTKYKYQAAKFFVIFDLNHRLIG